MKQIKQNDQVASRPSADRRYLQHEYASWFREFHWDWYITATFDREVTRAQAQELLKTYLNELERDLRCCISALVVMEAKWSGLAMPSSGHHFHFLLQTPHKVSSKQLCQRWEARYIGGRRCRQRRLTRCMCGHCEGGAMRCCPYDPAGGAADYLFKDLHRKTDDWWMHREWLLAKEPQTSDHSARVRRSTVRHEDRSREEQFLNQQTSYTTKTF